MTPAGACAQTETLDEPCRIACAQLLGQHMHTGSFPHAMAGMYCNLCLPSSLAGFVAGRGRSERHTIFSMSISSCTAASSQEGPAPWRSSSPCMAASAPYLHASSSSS